MRTAKTISLRVRLFQTASKKQGEKMKVISEGYGRLLVLLTLVLALGCGSNPGASGDPSTGNDDEKGIILLRYAEGSESTTQRENGFYDTMVKQYPEIRILSSDQYSGTKPEESLDKANQLCLKYGDKITGMFAVCEPNANGTLKALEQQGMIDSVKLVGFDPNQPMVRALSEGKMAGIVLQDPVSMGNLAVKAMVAHLAPDKAIDQETVMADGKLKKRISTGEYVATPENMNDEQMKMLLNPAQYRGGESVPEEPDFRIAVVPKGTSHEFWKSVHFGAQKAADEFAEAGVKVEILWDGPLNEDDREGQINIIQGFVTKEVDGICLAPLDRTALQKVVADAAAAGVPTVVFDSGLDGDDWVSYVATDNYQGGVLAAHRLAEVLKSEAAE